MSTTKHTGVRNHNTNMAHTPAGSEVTVNPSANPVVGAGQASGSTASPTPGPVLGGTVFASGDPAALAVFAAASAIEASWTSLEAVFGTPNSAAVRHVARSNKEILVAMDDIVVLLAAHPELGVGIDRTNLAAIADRVRAGIALTSAMNALQTLVEQPLRAGLADGWRDVRAVYHTASRLVTKDTLTTETLASVAALFVRAKRVPAAQLNGASHALKARNAGNRAATEAAKALAAQQKADALMPKVKPMPPGTVGNGDVTITPAEPPTAAPGTPGNTPVR